MNKKTLWISHSAISSYEKCPHLYYLEYEYRNPKTKNRIQIINPYFSLGLAVHETIEGLSSFSLKKRKNILLQERFYKIFKNYRGLQGGFLSKKKEEKFYERGVRMIERVEKSFFLSRPSINFGKDFPSVNLLGEDVKLVGNIDWIEALPGGGAHIIDFKTGNNKEKNGSLQLPIYVMLAKKKLKEKVKKTSYWYLEHDKEPVEQEMGDISLQENILKEKAKEIREAIEKKHFPCRYPGRCFACRDYEKIFQGEAELVSTGEGKRKDIFCVFKEEDVIEKVLEEDFLDEREKKMFETRINFSMDTVMHEMRLKREKADKISQGIKEKLKKNLRMKELKVLTKILKDGKNKAFKKN